MLGSRIGTLRNDRTPASVQATERVGGYALQKIRQRIMRRDCGICRCDACTRTGALKIAHEVEHYLPLWAGGLEADENRYAINAGCHEAKTACEAAMRSRYGFDLALCGCGRHGQARLGAADAIERATNV